MMQVTLVKSAIQHNFGAPSPAVQSLGRLTIIFLLLILLIRISSCVSTVIIWSLDYFRPRDREGVHPAGKQHAAAAFYDVGGDRPWESGNTQLPPRSLVKANAMFGAGDEDDTDFLSPSGGARLASLFGLDQTAAGHGNEFFHECQLVYPRPVWLSSPPVVGASLRSGILISSSWMVCAFLGTDGEIQKQGFLPHVDTALPNSAQGTLK
ncbi:hypothetical protein H8959_021181 [Pygathrix nigripes]